MQEGRNEFWNRVLPHSNFVGYSVFSTIVPTTLVAAFAEPDLPTKEQSRDEKLAEEYTRVCERCNRKLQDGDSFHVGVRFVLSMREATRIEDNKRTHIWDIGTCTAVAACYVCLPLPLCPYVPLDTDFTTMEHVFDTIGVIAKKTCLDDQYVDRLFTLPLHLDIVRLVCTLMDQQQYDIIIRSMIMNDTTCHTCCKTDVPLSMCAGCGFVKYCSGECQKIDWPIHKHHGCRSFKEKQRSLFRFPL